MLSQCKSCLSFNLMQKKKKLAYDKNSKKKKSFENANNFD